MLSFQAILSGSSVNYSWQTANELNSREFKIQHSLDEINFTNIGEVSVAGNSATNKNYQFLDKNPDNSVNYYRLKMVNIDARYTYSKVVHINVLSKYSFSLSPNPAKDNLYVQLYRDVAEQVSVKVLDMQGKTLYRHDQRL